MSELTEQYENLSWEDGNKLYDSKKHTYNQAQCLEALKIICHKKSMDLVKSGLVPTLKEFYASGAGDNPDYIYFD